MPLFIQPILRPNWLCRAGNQPNLVNFLEHPGFIELGFCWVSVPHIA